MSIYPPPSDYRSYWAVAFIVLTAFAILATFAEVSRREDENEKANDRARENDWKLNRANEQLSHANEQLNDQRSRFDDLEQRFAEQKETSEEQNKLLRDNLAKTMAKIAVFDPHYKLVSAAYQMASEIDQFLSAFPNPANQPRTRVSAIARIHG